MARARIAARFPAQSKAQLRAQLRAKLRALFFPALVAIVILQAGLPGAAQEKKKEQPLKTVHGVVQDKSENPLPAAIVFLKNMQSGSVKSLFADDAGGYRFSGLDPNTDYEIHAEFKGDVSPTKRLSALDSRRDIALNLTIPRKK